MPRVALFIDGANLHAAARALGFDIDYKRLLGEFQSRGTLVRAFYFLMIEEEFSPIRPHSIGLTTTVTPSSRNSLRNLMMTRVAAGSNAACRSKLQSTR